MMHYPIADRRIYGCPGKHIDMDNIEVVCPVKRYLSGLESKTARIAHGQSFD